MKNKSMIFTFCSVIILSSAACITRFMQLIKYTDKQTGLVDGGGSLTIIFYCCLAGALLCAVLYAAAASKYKRHLTIYGKKSISICFIVLSAAFFADFIKQCVNAYDYIFDSISASTYIAYNYLVPLCVCALTALLSCYYFIVNAAYISGSLLDSRKFTHMHFMPLLWGFCRLLIIMSSVLDLNESVEGFTEFLYTALFCGFSLCCISCIDKNGIVSADFSFFALAVFAASFSFSAARIMCVIAGKSELLSSADFSSAAYLATGIFALMLEMNVYIKPQSSDGAQQAQNM